MTIRQVLRYFAIGEAEQLLDLPQPGPRERAGEQPLDEGADRGPLDMGVAGHALRIAQRVGARCAG